MNRFGKVTSLVCALVLAVSLLAPALALAEATPVAKVEAPYPTAYAGLKQIIVSWFEVPGATSYLIYRGTTPAVTTKTVYKTVPAWAVVSMKRTPSQKAETQIRTKARLYDFVDTKVTVGTPYFYKMVAVVGGVKTARGPATGAVAFSKVPTVKITKTTAGVKLVWTAIARATTYELFHRQWILGGRGDMDFLTHQSKRSYIDTDSLPGKKYTYYLGSYYEAGGVLVDTGFHLLQDYLVPKAAMKN